MLQTSVNIIRQHSFIHKDINIDYVDFRKTEFSVPVSIVLESRNIFLPAVDMLVSVFLSSFSSVHT
jgi:hypothetical protein